MQVTGSACLTAPVYQSGDANNDGTLDAGETWRYTCSMGVINSTTINHITARATAVEGSVIVEEEALVCQTGCHNWFVYHSNRDGNWEIYRANTNPNLDDPAEPIDLSQGDREGVDDLEPSLSPNGQWVAFTSNRDGIWQIYRLDRITGDVTLLSDGRDEYQDAVYEPTGDQLLFRSIRDGNSGLYLMNIDGKDVKLISDLDGDKDLYAYEVRSGMTEALTFNAVDDYAPDWNCGDILLYNSDELDRPQVFRMIVPAFDGETDQTQPHTKLTFDDADNLFPSSETYNEENASELTVMGENAMMILDDNLPQFPTIGFENTEPDEMRAEEAWDEIDGCGRLS